MQGLRSWRPKRPALKYLQVACFVFFFTFWREGIHNVLFTHALHIYIDLIRLAKDLARGGGIFAPHAVFSAWDPKFEVSSTRGAHLSDNDRAALWLGLTQFRDLQCESNHSRLFR